MTVKRKKDTATKRVVLHKVADIPGGVSVATGEVGRDFLPEGTPVSAPDANGRVHVIKFAALKKAATNSTVAYKVAKDSGFQVGDFLMLAAGAKSYAITAIDKSNSEYDTLTVGTTLGAAAAIGAYVLQATAESASTGSAAKYAAFAITGSGVAVTANDNCDVDAWVIAVTKGNALPDEVASALKGVINY